MHCPSAVVFALICSLGVTGLRSRAADEPPPTGNEILNLVRLSYTQQDQKLGGQLRDDKTGRKEPFELTMQQKVIRFRFQNPPEIVHLDLATVPATLKRVQPGGATEVPMEQYGEQVRGMDLSFEDLSMRFLYWQNAVLRGEDTVKTAKCWIVRVTAPDRRGPYGTVDLWVHQGSGGIARMEAYNGDGKKVKVFEVNSIQKVNNATILKEMRMESFDPATGKRTGRTYMTLDKS